MFAVRRFAIRFQATHGGKPITLHEGRNIGHKAIVRFPWVAARKLLIEITESDRPPPSDPSSCTTPPAWAISTERSR